ncbi:bacillithiol biosynthesis deacetylase BshB1 [Flavobacteriaceae bacterium]|jgi:bacillithiol biosynthesis deacetylase BshB1|nr:bacillithiol biosynthesis deacetylase BshB1 [Flavobacteriaceae bacterium]MDB2464075.1 bacillithiol biosynthesis deacetylase BshB1 [Flavobacteriaceae bacterium]
MLENVDAVDILAFGAHPDDVEMSAGATLAKEIAAGKTVGIVDLTRGELGTRGTPEIRKQEALNAAKILGASFRVNLGMADGFFQNDRQSQLKVIEVLRIARPKIVLCNALQDRHIDHPKGSDLVSDACFLSGLRKIETLHQGISQDPWRPAHVYHYIQWNDIEPNFVVDVTGFMEQKLASVFAYKSQFFDPNSKEPQTPISTENARDSLSYRYRNLGRLIGTEFGEGFNTKRYVATRSLFDLI